MQERTELFTASGHLGPIAVDKTSIQITKLVVIHMRQTSKAKLFHVVPPVAYCCALIGAYSLCQQCTPELLYHSITPSFSCARWILFIISPPWIAVRAVRAAVTWNGCPKRCPDIAPAPSYDWAPQALGTIPNCR
ncbi:hypothetical protein EMCRGX_G013824 [Ephydatia muelleri]